jgi:hypothetical protein
MHSAISHELARTRIADLCRQAQREVLARAATQLPSSAPRPGRHPIPGRVSRQRSAWSVFTMLI